MPEPLQFIVIPLVVTLEKVTPDAWVVGAAQAALVANLKKPSVLILFELLIEGELNVPPIEE